MIPAGQTDSRLHRRIGKYAVTGRIGRGGMGMVYRGYDQVLEREVALKTLTLEGNLDEESRQRFEVEAKAAAKLQHPNIVTVFELGEERGIPFIAMELLPGVDLETLVRSGEPLLLAEKLDIMIQVCRGLAYAHEHRVIHRDIKPSNIRLLDDGTAKIMDFGIAKLGGTNLTKSGMMVGTVHYMSPEQIRGQTLDGRSDVFSVGVILYELLAGRRPFLGDGATDVLFKIVHEPPPPVPIDLGVAGPRLQEVLVRALAKDRDERYPTAARLADDLAEILTAQTRPRAVAAQQQDLDEVAAARRLLKEGRVEEGHRRLQVVVQRSPELLDARRALRTASREMTRRQRPPAPETEDFPELEATFQASPTRRAPETEVVAPTVVQGLSDGTVLEPRSSPRTVARALWIVAAGLAGVALLAVGLVRLRSAAPRPHQLTVRSVPPGAAILADGRDTGVVTDGVVTLPPESKQVVLTFRKAGYRDETRTVALPAAGPPIEVALAAATVSATLTLSLISEPVGAAVSLDGARLPGVTPLSLRLDPMVDHVVGISLEGHRSQEVRLAPGRFPTELRVTLEPAGPTGVVLLSSSYPVDVAWRGKVLAKAQASSRLALPAGRQTLNVTAPGVFLRTNLNVEVRANGETAADTPRLGRLSIRANPDNCQVFIDGGFVDYPPIIDKPVAAGNHTVSFKWPDGTRREEVVQVAAGAPAFVTGRRD